MAQREGYDYSWGRPSGAAIRNAGRDFVVRYLFDDGQGGKGLDQSEINDLQANGIAIVPVYEEYANSFRGRGAGVAQAQRAQAALDKLSLDKSLPIYFAADWDTTEADQADINAALEGAASVIGLDRVGIYGSFYVMNRSRERAKWLWQTYAWSGGQVADGIHLYQYKNGQTLAGHAVDFTRALQDQFGQSAVAGTPAPAGKTNEQLATEVLAGAWGNGDDRKNRLTAAGFDYNAVQAIVNARVGTPALKPDAVIANEVIAGAWGNGDDRKNRLAAAGYNYDNIQAIVNTKVNGSSAAGATYITVPYGPQGYLSNLAAKYGTTVGQIVEWNKGKYPISANVVNAGWVIRVK